MSVAFGHPVWLWALLGLPLVAFVLALGGRSGRRELARFTGPTLLDALAPGYSWRRNLLKGLLQTLALALIIVSLAQPRFGTQLVKVEREGIDIVLALDTSLSMLAEDMLPSRLERAKHEMVDLIRGLDGDRVGIVAFAGAAYPLCPLTVDYDAALMFLRSIDVYTVSEPGTAIDKAIATSAALFDESRKRDRAVVIVTDGENHEGSPLEAATEAGERGIRIYTIGIGNPSGELIPERANDGSIAGYKKDRRGETVLTRLDENALQEVATATGGKYLPATNEGLELQVLYKEIAGMERRKIKGEFVERRKERFWMFLAAAALMLIVDALLSARAPARVLRRRRALHTGAAVVALAVLALFAAAGTSHARSVKRSEVSKGNDAYGAGEYDEAIARYRSALGDTLRLPGDFQGVFYNEANALFMQERFGEAIARYQRAWSEDSTLTGQMLYNRGNAFIRAGQVQEAVESYVQALQYLPDDEQARHNLEMALRALQQQQQEQQEQQQQGDGENQDQDQQQQQEQQDGDSQNQEQQQQEQQQQEQQEGEQQEQEQQPDSTQVPPPQPDSTQVPQPELSPEDLAQLSKEDAMRILQALEELEKQLQKERRRAAFRRLKKSGKDW